MEEANKETNIKDFNMTNCNSRFCGKFMTKLGVVALYQNNQGYYVHILKTNRKYMLTGTEEPGNIYEGILPERIMGDETFVVSSK